MGYAMEKFSEKFCKYLIFNILNFYKVQKVFQNEIFLKFS